MRDGKTIWATSESEWNVYVYIALWNLRHVSSIDTCLRIVRNVMFCLLFFAANFVSLSCSLSIFIFTSDRRHHIMTYLFISLWFYIHTLFTWQSIYSLLIIVCLFIRLTMCHVHSIYLLWYFCEFTDLSFTIMTMIMTFLRRILSAI